VLGVSERFACRVTGKHRATQRHQSVSATPDDPDTALRSWLRAYARDHPRRGFRPAYHDARGEGWAVNHKKIQRLWRQEGLRVPQRRRRKRHGTSTVSNTVTADAPNRGVGVGGLDGGVGGRKSLQSSKTNVIITCRSAGETHVRHVLPGERTSAMLYGAVKQRIPKPAISQRPMKPKSLRSNVLGILIARQAQTLSCAGDTAVGRMTCRTPRFN
jgi:transposase InsO family protein